MSKRNPKPARFSTKLARKFAEDLVLDGKRPNAVNAYRAAIAKLAETFHTPPDRLSEQQVRQYLLDCRKQLALNSIRPILGAIKFLYRVTIPRDWPTLAAMRLPKSRTVPKVLSPEKCWRIIHATKQLHGRTAMQTQLFAVFSDRTRAPTRCHGSRTSTSTKAAKLGFHRATTLR